MSDVFELMLCYDQVDGSNLAMVERLCRWYQDIEGQHEKEESKGASYAYVSGMPRAGGGVAFNPELRVWVAEKVGKEVAVMKEKRKAREERELARKPGGGQGRKS